MPTPDQLADLRSALRDRLIAASQLPEFVATNILLGDAREAPKDFDQRRAHAIGKAQHKAGLVLYEGTLQNVGQPGDLELESQHLIEFYRSPQRNAAQASNRHRSSDPILLDLIRVLHGWTSPSNNPDEHCHYQLHFDSSTPIADPHYEAHLLTFTALLDLPALQ